MKTEKRYQILRRRKGEEKFSFVAHGATYSEASALEIKIDYRKRGDTIRLIPAYRKID